MKYLTPLLVMVFAQYCIGQSAFTVDVNRDTIYLGNTVTVSFVSHNIQGKPSVVDLPFQVVSGPNQSMSSSFINGKGTTSNTISYILMPETQGVFEIPSIELISNDSVYQSEAIRLVVFDNPEGIVQKDNMEQQGFRNFFSGRDLFGTLPPKAKKKSKPKRKMKRI